jgi:GAF domain-containing protein
MNDYETIYRVTGELSRLLLRQTSLETTLAGIGSLAVAAIPSCNQAGVTLEEHGKVVARTTTGDPAEPVDAYQYEIDEGPCINASRTKSTVLIEDMASDDRWPRYAAFAHSYGVRSTYSIPMTQDGNVVGVLNLYSTDTAFGRPDEAIGLLFAEEAATAVRHAATFAKGRELVNNLKVALDSRAVIGAGVGIIMHRDGISMDAAFSKLVDLSQRENLKLRDVAERITDQYEAEPE